MATAISGFTLIRSGIEAERLKDVLAEAAAAVPSGPERRLIEPLRVLRRDSPLDEIISTVSLLIL